MNLLFSLYKRGKKTAVLDHACYKEPAPYFLKVAKGVEETLCAHSNLYKLLTGEMKDYFKYNAKHKNRGLLLDRGFYISDVEFEYNGEKAPFDVVGATAPNYKFARQYKAFNKEENTKALYNRIDFILSVALKENVDVLIIGPFGCSVYGQSIEEVASIFKELLSNKYSSSFESVYFNTDNKDSYLKVAEVFS